MTVTGYGLDYSARELSPAEVSGAAYQISFLIRYIGWPNNRKCISHYPGAYAAHVAAGRLVLLVAEQGTADPAGGYPAGVAMATRALIDARAIGYPDSLPIFFCADGWLTNNSIATATAMAFLDGAAAVVGRARVGAYGFRDFIGAAWSTGRASWRWLCGAPPNATEIASGLCQLYQWNGGALAIGGMSCDLNWSYVDLGALRARKDALMALTDAEATELIMLVRTLTFQLVSGDAPPGSGPGWTTWTGGTDERLTVVDYLRRANVEVRQVHVALAAATVRADGLAARLSHLEALLGSTGATTVTPADKAGIAAAVLAEMSRRTGVPAPTLATLAEEVEQDRPESFDLPGLDRAPRSGLGPGPAFTEQDNPAS